MSTKVIHSPQVLILASRYDFSCDYIVESLRAIGTSYFRLNSEDLPGFELVLDPIRATLRGKSEEIDFSIIAEDLQSVYYRQPTFLRESALAGRAFHEQFSRAQWSAFIRSLMVFDKCLWVNHPARTYTAEHKAIQLRAAAKLGFEVPSTRVANSRFAFSDVADDRSLVALKGLETVIARETSCELFGYTNMLTKEEVDCGELVSAPAIIQAALVDKLDLRVTVVGGSVWCAAITRQGKRIWGDWRLAKTDAEFKAFRLPGQVTENCVALTKTLGLQFGAIDLALSDGKYYFLEINPTGEWAWLQSGIGFEISNSIANCLTKGQR